nr:hypothetical protein [uncultured Helicobacter sp.]
MDTNTQKELIEQVGSSAFEQADKLTQKPQSNDEPLSFEKSFDTNSQAKADELINVGLQSQSQSQNEPYAITPPDVSEGVKYQKYRNTGVDYFDRKGNLSLLDAYLAKQLGLNVSYNFHKIDMKVDNRTRNVNFTKSYNDYATALASIKKVGMGQASIANADSGNTLGDSLRKKGDKVLLGFYNGLTDARAANVSNKAIYATTLGRGNKLLKSQEVELDSLFADTTNNAERSAKVNTITLQNLIADLEVSLHIQKSSGVLNPQAIQARQNTINTAKEVQALFANGDWKSKEGIHNNSIKLFTYLKELDKHL